MISINKILFFLLILFTSVCAVGSNYQRPRVEGPRRVSLSVVAVEGANVAGRSAATALAL